MRDSIDQKEHKRSLKDIVKDTVMGAGIGTIPGGLAGAFFGFMAYANTPQATAASDFYPILVSLAAFGATAGAIYYGDGIYLEARERAEARRDFENQSKLSL